MHPITILSFGYLHGPEPRADIVEDLREKLRDPAHVPTGEMLDMTGLDEEVSEFVFATPNATPLFFRAVVQAKAKAKLAPTRVAFGCVGGRHRSVAFAQKLHDYLLAQEHDVEVKHLHVHLPRVIRQP